MYLIHKMRKYFVTMSHSEAVLFCNHELHTLNKSNAKATETDARDTRSKKKNKPTKIRTENTDPKERKYNKIF